MPIKHKSNDQVQAKALGNELELSDTNIFLFDEGGEGLPNKNNLFNRVLIQRSSHLVFSMEALLRETNRLLKPEGSLVITTYLVPGTRLRGKKARKLREAGDYINAVFQFHSSQHRRFHSRNKWEDMLQTAGFTIENLDEKETVFDFDTWADESSIQGKDRVRLKAMLVQAPKKTCDFLTPQFTADRIRFRLPEISILAKIKRTGNDVGDRSNP